MEAPSRRFSDERGAGVPALRLRRRGERGSMSLQALAVGAATGFLGAIPPGPAGIAVAGHAACGQSRRAVAIGLGSALVDFVLCAAVSLGAGSAIARLTEPPWVRASLAGVYALLGAWMLARALLRRSAPAGAPARRSRDGFAGGVLRGLANPSLLANWTLVIAGLGAAGLLPKGAIAGLAFALGVGIGVGGWFSALARIVARARGGRLAGWLRAAGAAVGLVLMVGGGAAAVRALSP